ncbi:MAG TPA: alanine--tRNA ligase [Thermoanaerobaculia bacterium]|nr:alanine--tRNA ligase [Thermoanaerobaculia bacterium]HUM31302.1 alanine--tRNA ligase [Thermoanaerobaculia bacterium]HXK69656.1 alanine--tRNA ligase [Thermoanaerobaculia bacterium]
MTFSHHEVRQKFLDFFASCQHTVVPSSSLLPAGDPSLLFSNAGMNQFKDLFLGREVREYRRAASSQKCMRVGGKHNDLDNVGFTPRHHTFFEMLGNFSFGDYFKDDAIRFAWDLVTKEYRIDPDRLVVSIFEEDDEAHRIWNQSVGVSPDKIVRLGAKDNFWAMGDTGPCGPCSEIYYDQGSLVGCGKEDCSPACDCGRFLEFWNLVFMQYNRDESGELTPLPSPSIDTGMGLERLAAILQGHQSNYGTDLFSPLLQKISSITDTPFSPGSPLAPAFRVIADHTRAVTFLIADGVFPSNEGRGYVLRRIIRRSLRFAHKLEWHAPVIPRLVETVIDSLASIYPEIARESSVIRDLTAQEEERFEKTLDRGVEIVGEIVNRFSAKGAIPGEELFYLYDTHGIPVDFVEEMAREEKVQIDVDGFRAHLDEQRERSKKTTAFKDDYRGYYEELSRTVTPTRFVGYEETISDSTILAILKDGERVPSAHAGDVVELIVDRTPFYAESGGQVGDTGTLAGTTGKGDILDTQKPVPTHWVHRVRLTEGTVSEGETVTMNVDDHRRKSIMRHHTATHLLHAALREVLGSSVKQMGSLVDPDRLRFDFSFSRGLTREEMETIERRVAEGVLADVPVTKELLPLEEAKKMGALAFFGEKYGQEVRVVAVPGHSMEFCGGCHVERTGEIGAVKITDEKAIAAGVRRLEAVAGVPALHRFQVCTTLLDEISVRLPGPHNDLPLRVEALQSTIRELERTVRELKEKAAAGSDSGEDRRTIQGVDVLLKAVSDFDPPTLRSLADRMKQKLSSGIVILGNTSGEKATILVAVTDDLAGKIPASSVARSAGTRLGGSGGGKPHLAQAGGPAPGDMRQFLIELSGDIAP